MKINGNMQHLTNHVTSLSEGKTEQIERQIQSLQEEITKLDTDKALDSKAKQEKKKQLEEELANLQQQLTQEQIKQRKTEKEEEK
ncbi:MAG: FlxA-like family protein, partial [Lachnospiraceae bacterium]|nr:FlxA-like family protein [Lachnospiraceae bacterium]